jgi:hypothetical protein
MNKVSRSFVKPLLVCGLLVVLSGCAALNQRIAENDDAYCRGYGSAPGSPAYAQCRQAIDMQRMGAFQQDMQQYTRPPVNTTCTTSGPYTNCRSY